jgi:biotin transporter BioY
VLTTGVGLIFLLVDLERTMNYVPFMFNKGGCIMIRAVVEEAAALASITLFVGMIVVWAQVLAVL